MAGIEIDWKQARDLADVLAADPTDLEGNLAVAFLEQARIIRELVRFQEEGGMEEEWQRIKAEAKEASE